MFFNLATEAPVSIESLRMVRWLNDQIEARLGAEHRIPQEAIDTWARVFAESAITQIEVETFAAWHAEHYQERPQIPLINRAIIHLREHGSLPAHRLACQNEVTAVDLLKLLEEAGMTLHDARHSLCVAAAMAQVGYYHQHDREYGFETDPVFVEHELVGCTRFALLKARDLMPEIEQDAGMLSEARKYLLGE